MLQICDAFTNKHLILHLLIVLMKLFCMQKRNNMILTAHQPVYLPWLGLFHKISLSDTYVFFDEVQYLPKDWMNRNYIKTKRKFLMGKREI